MLGLDTGFFIRLLQGDARAEAIWRSLMESEEEAATSCLSLFELERLSLKGVVDSKDIEVLLPAIRALCKIAWIDDAAILARGATLSHGLGIPAVDSLILASIVNAGCSEIYTTDRHLQRYRQRGIRISLLA